MLVGREKELIHIILRKKITFILFAVLLIGIWVGTGANRAQAAANPGDISGHWASSQIMYLLNKGVVTGYADGTFKPDQAISRAEFITLINQAFNFSSEANLSYSDVNPGDWYYVEIARAQAAGYISGYPDGSMLPDSQITREEAAVILAKVLKLDTSSNRSLAFADANNIGAWSSNSVATLVQAGYIGGYPDGNFRPLNAISRAEAAVIIAGGLGFKVTPPGSINVKDYGAQGDGITDDTAAIQRAVDYAESQGGGTIDIPDGIFLINPNLSIKLKDNTTLSLSANATLKATPTGRGRYSVVLISNVSNAGVVGGSIVGDRATHTRTTGEWGMGINIEGSNNVHVADISISDCWGDGIYIGDAVQNYCNHVVIERFKIDNNRRNGISVISAQNLTISNGVISNTNGTDPQSGLDLEPNLSTDILQNILIENLHTAYNAGYGIQFWLGAYAGSTHTVSITIVNQTDDGSVGGTLNNYADYISQGYNINVK